MTINTVVFDAYGTLFDTGSAARTAAGENLSARLAGCSEALSEDWRRKQLEYAWIRTLTGHHTDFWHVTQDALDWAMERHGFRRKKDAPVRDRLLDLYKRPDAYPEAAKALARLKEKGFATAILSNGSPEMLKSAVDRAGLGAHLDAVISVEEAGAYKPDPRAYALVSERFPVPRGEVLYVSANGWDTAAATSYGFRTLWVNRAGLPRDRLPAQPDLVQDDLSKVHAVARQLLIDLRSSAAEIGTTEYFVNRDGLKLAYRDDGLREGPVLLCLAGLTRNLADFDYVARDFADRARILRLDTRGRGQSDWDPDYLNYNLIRESRDALDLLDHLDIPKAAVLGTSRGGLIAMALAGGSKARLSGVCLNDIGPEIEAEGLAYIGQYLGNRPKAKSYEEVAEGLAVTAAQKFPGVPLERWHLHARRIFCEAPDGLDLRYDALLRKSILEQSATDAIQDLWLLFKALDGLPLALIRGENSDILSRKTAEEMQHRRPDMIFAEVPARGHVPFLDEPEAQAAIGAFIDRLA